MTVKHNLLQQMSDQDQEVESTISNEELELEQEQDDTEDVDALKEQLSQAREAQRQILARAKKAEAQLKEKTSQSTQTEQKPTQFINALTAEDVEVKILQTQKVSEDEIAYLKKIAAINGTSLIEAMEDPIYTGFKDKKEADKKSENARLGASRGSSSVRKEKTTNTVGLTKQEHKDLWRQQNGL